MKQENLDELKNIYLGLVTGGEGPELLSEAPKVTVVDPNFERKAIGNELKYMQTDAFKRSLRAGTPGNTSGTPVQNPAKAAVPVKPVPVKPKPFEYNKTNLGTEQDAAFRAGGGNASVGDAYTAADVVARGRAALKAKAAAEASRNGSSGSGGPIPTPTASRPAATTAPKPTTPTPTTAPKPAGSAMDQWTRANPTLAAKVKPGQSGYDTIKTRLSADNDRGPSTPTPAAAEPSGETDRLKKALDIKKSDVTSSYQFPMSKTLRDLSDSYNEIYEAKKKLDQVGQEDDDIDNDGDTDKSDKYLLNRRKVRSKAIDEGIGSAIRGLFGKKKEPEAPKPLSRGAELRARYNTGPDKSETSAKRKILDITRARAERDEKEYGDSTYSKSVATKSREAHDRYLRAGYNKYGADRPDSGGMGGSGGSGRGSKAAKRAAALNNSYDLYDLIQSHLLEYGFADTEEGANMIIENMSPSWIKQILSED